MHFEKGAKVETSMQKNAVKLARHLAAALGIDIYFCDLKADTR